MITSLYSVKRRRNILPGDYDVQNNARCSHYGERHCSGPCPRHDAPAYAEMMARHAGGESPSLPAVSTMSDREREFHGSNAWGR